MDLESTRPQRGRTLAIGFGVTVAMWVICYLSMINPGLVIGELLFALILACLVAGGFVAGRFKCGSETGWMAGLKVGLVAATLNLLLLGSLVGGQSSREKLIQFSFWIAGNFVISIILASVGGAFGSRHSHRPRLDSSARPEDLSRRIECHDCGYDLRGHRAGGSCPECGESNSKSIAAASERSPWYSRFVLVAAVAVFLLLITGGLVTGLQAGLAVPDWPNSFGHNMLLYPLSQMIGGVYYEHAHRLYGMLVGVTAITVAVSIFWFDKRGWVRAIAIAFLLMVCIQGVLGGTRVTEKSIPLAIMHGMFGQIVFVTIVALAAFTSPTWTSRRSAIIKPSAMTDRRWSTVLPCLLIVQLGLGAMYRHLGRSGNNPPEPVHVLWTHILVAVLVTILAVIVGGRAWGGAVNREQPVLPALGKTLLCLVGGQVLLGVIAMIAVWSRGAGDSVRVLEVIVTTAHQAAGAMLLAFATLLMLWTRRLLASEAATSIKAVPRLATN